MARDANRVWRTHPTGVVEVLDSKLYRAMKAAQAEEGDARPDVVTCGECGRTWDDAAVSDLTPAPAGRCPFEDEHADVPRVEPRLSAAGATSVRELQEELQQALDDLSAVRCLARDLAAALDAMRYTVGNTWTRRCRLLLARARELGVLELRGEDVSEITAVVSATPRFIEVYAEELARAVEQHPEEYCYPASEVPAVVGRMQAALLRGSYNKDGRAIKATCKRLGIKHTYGAINERIAEEQR